MPRECHIEKSQGLLIITGQGTIRLGDMVALYKRMLADPDHRVVRLELADAREVSFSVTPDDIMDLAKAMRGRPFADQVERRATVAGSGLQYGLGRMFANLVAPSGHEVRPFRDIDEARRWLEEGQLADEGT